MTEKSKRRHWADLFLIFAIVYLGTQMGIRILFPEKFASAEQQAIHFSLSPQDATVKSGHHPVLTLLNNTDHELSITDRCPAPPVDVYYAENGTPEATGDPEIVLGVDAPCAAISPIPAGKQGLLDLASWKYAAFGRNGYYTVALTLPPQPAAATGAVLKTTFTVYEAGWMTQTFRAFVSKPLLNLLVFIASIVPGYNLGVAIIILTIIVKLLLFIPTQHGLEGQKKLQAIQPKIEEVRKRFTGNQQKINEETMKLWKEHKVNPFQSLLPVFIQFPILIGLFYAVRDGSHLALSTHLLYGSYKDLPWTFGTMFLGMDLLKPSVYILPPLLVAMQFFQMKLSFAMAKKKADARAEKQKAEKVPEGPKGEKMPLNQQELQQKMMLYILPFMIGFFAIKFPAAVSLYWGVSTVFAIGQQIVVNRKG
ncbi:MAG: preprotein translocase subunit YidC [Candidatus Peregrinibacteria bacterium Greene0416_62]|nr:MAG: preprotein translocase subunit YidC [Candidatus Peregrinibacteria bacterium Greene0416_62]TSC98690.1 MAG: preprotein translocase subunit YidC [Candidatus Peregrinibacteria bacterium Greene1014_49]